MGDQAESSMNANKEEISLEIRERHSIYHWWLTRVILWFCCKSVDIKLLASSSDSEDCTNYGVLECDVLHSGRQYLAAGWDCIHHYICYSCVDLAIGRYVINGGIWAPILILNQISAALASRYHFLKINFKIIFQVDLYPQVSPPRPCMHPFCLPYLPHAPPCYLVPLVPKCIPQISIFSHPQPMFRCQCERPSFTYLQNKSKNIIFVLFFMFLDEESIAETIWEIIAVYSKNYWKIWDIFECKLCHVSQLKHTHHVLHLCLIGLNFHPVGTNVFYWKFLVCSLMCSTILSFPQWWI
jgi:hypothetical protein